MIKIPVSMIGEPEHILERYRELIRKGESPGIASILATRSAPALETATNHYVGLKPMHEVDGMKDYTRKVREQARRAGIQIGEHSIYNATIADHRGGADPNAWVHNGESPDKFRRVMEERGVASEDFRSKGDASLLAEREAKRAERIQKQTERREAILAEKREKRQKQKA